MMKVMINENIHAIARELMLFAMQIMCQSSVAWWVVHKAIQPGLDLHESVLQPQFQGLK
jgi:hypothetical protein